MCRSETRRAVWSAVAIVLAISACEPELVVGDWTCNPRDAAVMTEESVDVPWSTGFESEFCDYERAFGFCYAAASAKFETVRSPVHSGRYAAAFRVTAGDDDAYQTRCVRQGVQPTEAYYGAWFFIPERATNGANWNLVHFRGGDPSTNHGLWDISLENRSDGTLQAFVFDFMHGMVRRPSSPSPIPIGAWFQLEFYLRRAADSSGAMALYQDGRKLLEATNLVTDDTRWGQWYVGNLATELTPADSTVYIDDVTIRSIR